MSSEPKEQRSPQLLSDGSATTLVYESNPKHRDPWQPGRKGSICDLDVRPHAQTLLAQSELDGEKRFAVFNGRAYCAQEHRPGTWHGYPVGWLEVPPRLRRIWKQQGRISKRQLDLNWEKHQ
jgi:hypothetical protein